LSNTSGAQESAVRLGERSSPAGSTAGIRLNASRLADPHRSRTTHKMDTP
jgi:hypothetical protein